MHRFLTKKYSFIWERKTFGRVVPVTARYKCIHSFHFKMICQEISQEITFIKTVLVANNLVDC